VCLLLVCIGYRCCPPHWWTHRGWDYVNCLESIPIGDDIHNCAKLTTHCRNIFSETNNVPLRVVDKWANILSLVVGLGGALLITLAVRGDIFRLWSRLRDRRVRAQFTPVDTMGGCLEDDV